MKRALNPKWRNENPKWENLKSFLIVLFLLLSIGSYSQNATYQDAMRRNLARMDTARNADDLRQAGAKFEQISNVAVKEWLPSYYAGYSYLMMSFSEPDGTKKDALLDLAEKQLEASRQRGGDASELLVLEAFLSLGRIQVDPMGRGMEYSMKANSLLDKARQANPENPRVYYLQGTTLYNTPEQYGGGKEQALPVLKLAKSKFEVFTLPSEFWPNWGRQHLEQMLQQ